MTDIVLNMFIFFFISFSLLYTFSPERMKKLEINLPQAKSGQVLKETRTLTISITAQGVIYLGTTALTKEELQPRLAKAYKDNPEVGIILQIDKVTQFKDVVRVLDMLTATGIKKINVGVSQTDSKVK